MSSLGVKRHTVTLRLNLASYRRAALIFHTIRGIRIGGLRGSKAN